MKSDSRMGLAEVAPMLARGEQADADKGTDQDGENYDGECGGAAPAPSDGQARFQQAGIQEPDDEGPRLGRFPRPELSPDSVGPDRARDDREAEHQEAPAE